MAGKAVYHDTKNCIVTEAAGLGWGNCIAIQNCIVTRGVGALGAGLGVQGAQVGARDERSRRRRARQAGSQAARAHRRRRKARAARRGARGAWGCAAMGVPVHRLGVLATVWVFGAPDSL